MITRIRLDKDLCDRFGLRSAQIDGLGSLVVLTGPNGGGKTRYINGLSQQIERLQHVAHDLEVARDLQKGTSISAVRARADPKLITRITEFETMLRESIDHIPQPGWLGQIRLAYSTTAHIQARVNLTNQRAEDLLESGGAGFDVAYSGMYAFLAQTARALWNGDHPSTQQSDELKRSLERAKKFNEDVSSILGTKIEPKPNGHGFIEPTVFGRPFDADELSAGQKVLLTWAIILDRQAGHYKSRVVLLDEPELYLHPDACWQALQKLRSIFLPGDQLWIATHSLPLVAQAGEESLFFVENSAVTRATSSNSNVWRSLLGATDARERLLTFLDGDANSACVRFARECLLSPSVVDGKPTGDPQAEQLLAEIAVVADAGGSARVLEYGAGRGRLAAALADASTSIRKVSYVAYNRPDLTSDEDRTRCKDNVQRLCDQGVAATYCEDLADLQARDDDRADLVLLANVLHEVPVEEWLDLFAQLSRCARAGARLLVIEDQEPRVGELPHARGFLILERKEWRALLDDDPQQRRVSHNGRELTAFTIPFERIARLNTIRLGNALQLAIDRCDEAIRALRAKPVADHRSGRAHAFYAMMHYNATRAQKVYPSPTAPRL